VTHSQVSGSIAEECRLLSSSAKSDSRAIFIGFHSAAAIVEDLTGCGSFLWIDSESKPAPRVKIASPRFSARVAATERRASHPSAVDSEILGRAFRGGIGCKKQHHVGQILGLNPRRQALRSGALLVGLRGQP
jgi:hypothetical protein